MSEAPSLSRLTRVPAREVWAHEAHDFTPWLLQNVDVLSDLLGMDLVLEVAEHPVGGFSLDLKGYDEATGETVIVENQLEQSDHTHLGQIITYAAGTDPQTIVWVATSFRSEHRAAIDWLNERTDDRTRIFGVKINVVKIGNSDPAPNFDLVAQPNDWEKEVRKAASGRMPTDKELLQREFWEFALERIRAKHPQWTSAKTASGSWVDTSVGCPGVVVSMCWYKTGLVVQLYFNSPEAVLNADRYEALRARRIDFEAALGAVPAWEPMEGRKASRVGLISNFTRLDERDEWDAAVDWIIDSQARLRRAFAAVGGATIFEE